MRYMTLSEMLDDLRAEVGASLSAAHNVSQMAPHKALLRRVQEDLFLNFEWPHLQTSTTQTLDPSTRWSAYPDTFTLEGIQRVEARPTVPAEGKYVELKYGIGPVEMDELNSDDLVEGSTVKRWANYMQPTGASLHNMYEIWPIPDQETQLRFWGRRKLFPLTEETHTSTLDGPVIVLHAAAEILARQSAEDARLKLQKALDRRRLLGVRQRGAKREQLNLS